MVGSPFRDNVITSYISGASVVNCVISAYIHDRVMLERDENGLKRSGNFSLAPHLRGEGRGEGDSPQIQTRGKSPSPGSLWTMRSLSSGARSRDPLASPRRSGLSPQAGRGDPNSRVRRFNLKRSCSIGEGNARIRQSAAPVLRPPVTAAEAVSSRRSQARADRRRAWAGRGGARRSGERTRG